MLSCEKMDQSFDTHTLKWLNQKSKLIYSHSLAQKIVHFQTLPIINITITDINCEMYADAESKTLELCLDQIRVQKVHFQISLL